MIESLNQCLSRSTLPDPGLVFSARGSFPNASQATGSRSMPKPDDDIDALFKLPLTEFISARKALAARLKKNGLVSEAEGVKALAKPSISAWTVNQLYWRHREGCHELVATRSRFRQA